MDEIELTIERLGISGEGVARHHGFTIFVPGALPGEKVRAELYEKRKSFGRANVTDLLTVSPHRRSPICPLFGECGGCQLMHLGYEQQLETKRARVQDALERIGKFEIEVLPCIASPSPLAYRNKIQLPVRDGHRLGLYANNSHDFVEISRCFIHCSLGEKVLQEIQNILKEVPTPLRHLLIKTAESTQQALVIFVTESREIRKSLATQLMQRVPEVRGVFQNINSAAGNRILSSHFHKLAGEDTIEEKLCGLAFKVSPASFFQVNPQQAERLYQKVVEFAALTGKERVLDAYCGVGTLSLILAQHAKEVIGVEVSSEAIRDAKENAKLCLNNLKNWSSDKEALRNFRPERETIVREQGSSEDGNFEAKPTPAETNSSSCLGINRLEARFVCAPAENFIAELDFVDLAILNPPRKGCEPSFLNTLADRKPRKILYVSCDPATLARDLQILCARGYTLQRVQPFDMFPQTAHVETLTELNLL